MSGPPGTGSGLVAGRYSIQRQIGRGATATVFLAHDNVGGDAVALKILRSDLAQSAASDRFLREIRLTAKLEHPQILRVLDAGETEGTLYFALPYMEGGSLRQLIERERQLPIAHAVNIICTIAEALDYAHRQGLIHRDIKPENILFTNGQACLADFGIARALENALDLTMDSTSTGIIRGTVAYMSPEQASGSRAYDGRSDIFGLGCVLYEMLAGVQTFVGPTPEAVLAQRFTHPPRELRVYRGTVSDALNAVVMKALEFAPADRFASAGEMVKALRELEASAMLSRPTTREVVGSLRPPDRRWRAWLGLGGIALAAAVGVLMALPDGEPPPATGVPPRIAVMYFEDLTPDTTLRHVADGLTEELIYELSGVNAFRVISKNGVRPYRGSAVAIDSLVRALRVSTIIEGSVAQTPSGIRVLVRVVDARSNTYVDSISVELPVSQLIPIERAVAQKVASALRVRLGREVRLRQAVSGTRNRAAKDYVLRAQRVRDDAQSLAAQPHPQDRDAAVAAYSRADSLLARAQAEDPRWAKPVIERGWAAYESRQLLPADQRVPALQASLAHAEQAVRVAPLSPEAFELRGTVQLAFVAEESDLRDSTRLRLAEVDLRAALDRDSTLAGAWASLSHVLWLNGSHADASLAAQRALREDAYLSRLRPVFLNLFFDALMLGEIARAGEWCRRGQLSAPDDWQFVDCELTHMRHDIQAAPDTQRAWTLVRRLERMDPAATARVAGRPYHPIYRRIVAATISARAGDHRLARAELAGARSAAGRDSSLLLDLAYDEAYLRLVLGEKSRAADLLTRLMHARPVLRPLLIRDPLFKELPVSELTGSSGSRGGSGTRRSPSRNLP